jgi:ABC-type cobalamin/Fe3+-siderophores transport system ATPase subunit
MLQSLEITNFRSFRDFSVPHLGLVNLIVGKNNSGKSTVLEALKILARQANPTVLDQIAQSHDEHFVPTDTLSAEDIQLGYHHFFPNRRYPSTDDERIYIGDVEQTNYVRIAHALFFDEEEELVDPNGEHIVRRRRQVVSKDTSPKGLPERVILQGLQISTSRSQRQAWIDLQRDSSYSARRGQLFWDEITETPFSYVPTQFISRELLAKLWDSVALTENDEFVTQALRLIEGDVAGLVFIQKERSRARYREPEIERTAIVKLATSASPVPLSSMGDGMLRILQLILALFPARNGFLLIDEFENGLHYSVQEDVWRLIITLATRLKIQVFATTHSWDCIEAFKNAATQSPEDGVLFRVGKSVRKSDEGKVVATLFREKELANLTRAHIEVR